MIILRRYLCVASILFSPSLLLANDVSSKDKGPILGGKIQVLGVGERLKDDYADDNRIYLFLKQARLNVRGKKNTFKYYIEMGFAGEEETVVAPNPGVAMNLLDMHVDWELSDSSFLKIGQFKVPYSRERITDSSYLQQDSRSIQNLAFRMGRDVGIAFHSYPGNFAYTLGVFTGGGRDVPERYLPEHLGFPLVALRAGINNNYDEDLFTVKQHKQKIEKTESGIFINGLYIKDSLIGHSTVLNVKLAEKSLLTNSNWNPYIGKAPLEKGSLYQMGVDGGLRIPYSSGILNLEAELNYAKFWNHYGEVKAFGGREQAGWFMSPFEFSIRHAFILPDGFAYAYTDATTKQEIVRDITGKKPIHEVTPGVTYFFKNESAKLVFDFPILIQVPVATEDKIGSYVLTEQMDQASVLSKSTGKVERQNVLEARLMFQMIF